MLSENITMPTAALIVDLAAITADRLADFQEQHPAQWKALNEDDALFELLDSLADLAATVDTAVEVKRDD